MSSFRKLIWFLSGSYMDDPERYAKSLRAFMRMNKESLSKEELGALAEIIAYNGGEK